MTAVNGLDDGTSFPPIEGVEPNMEEMIKNQLWFWMKMKLGLISEGGFGYTSIRDGCRNAQNRTAAQGHSTECRKRMGKQC